jgi:ASPM-SPD-2-Hydin domain-containing protein/centrosomal CEP192-like protein
MILPHKNHQPQSLRTTLPAILLGLLAFMAAAPSPAAAQLASSLSVMKFGSVALGTPETQLVILTNTGTNPVELTSIAVDGPAFRISRSAMPLTLAAGASTPVSVTFTPTATGWIEGWISFNSNASNPRLGLSVRGTGVKSEPLSASPASLSFGQVPVGTTSKLSVTLTNNCTCTQSVSGLQIVGGAFGVVDPPPAVALSSGQTETLTVSFTPQAAGITAGSVMVNGPFVNIPVAGTGTSTTTTAGTLSVTPSVSFGSVVLGNSSTQTSSLTATGGSVTVTSASSSNGQFAIAGISLPVTIPAGQSVSFGVIFTPTSAGTDAASLSFASSSSSTKTVEALTATATMPYISLSWSPSTSNVTGYNIYRGTSSSGPFARLNSALNTATSYVDNSVGVGATYFYATTAVNSSGAESSYSNLAEVNIP